MEPTKQKREPVGVVNARRNNFKQYTLEEWKKFCDEQQGPKRICPVCRVSVPTESYTTSMYRFRGELKIRVRLGFYFASCFFCRTHIIFVPHKPLMLVNGTSTLNY